MDERETGNNPRRHPQRNQTDASLRVERDKSDTRVQAESWTVEEEADGVVKVARLRADQIVKDARDDADRKHPQSAAAEARSERARDQADALLDEERAQADAVLARERTERKRVLAEFLAVEREATDQDLFGERTQSDTALAARDDFLANVSHDLRSLLGGLSLNADLLGRQAPEGSAGDAVRRNAATSQRLVSRMARLINDLLDVTSIEAGRLALLPEPVDVAELLRETLDAFTPLAAAKHVALVADAAAPQLTLRLDGGRILQVLANLVSNAIKFTPAQGRIALWIRPQGNELQFTVSDTGVGIAADALSQIFERFRQVSPDRRGLGLGLHISKSLVEAHGGRLWAESTVGAGSSFHFTLPMLQPAG